MITAAEAKLKTNDVLYNIAREYIANIIVPIIEDSISCGKFEAFATVANIENATRIADIIKEILTNDTNKYAVAVSEDLNNDVLEYILRISWN